MIPCVFWKVQSSSFTIPSCLKLTLRDSQGRVWPGREGSQTHTFGIYQLQGFSLLPSSLRHHPYTSHPSVFFFFPSNQIANEMGNWPQILWVTIEFTTHHPARINKEESTNTTEYTQLRLLGQRSGHTAEAARLQWLGVHVRLLDHWWLQSCSGVWKAGMF